MPKMMSHYTEMARQDSDTTDRQSIVAAVPATRPDPVDELMGAGGGCLAPLAGLFGAAIAAILLGTNLIRRKFMSHGSEIPANRVLIVIRNSGVDLVELKRFGRGLGRILHSYELSDVSYYRTEMAVDTRMRVGAIEWAIHGWFERDLRAALGPLGVSLEQLPLGIPCKELDQ